MSTARKWFQTRFVILNEVKIHGFDRDAAFARMDSSLRSE